MARKHANPKKWGLRDPQSTREMLLQAAFREVYRSGFQGAGIEAILSATGVTRGALYYHFDSKEALGYAIVEEIVTKVIDDSWMRHLRSNGSPLDILIGIVQRTSVRPEDVKGGCPLLNLTIEMSSLDDEFRKRLERIIHAWHEGVATILRKGQAQGAVRRDLNPDETASFLIAMYEGYASLAKNAQDPKVWNVGIKNIVGWLESLRAPEQLHRAKDRRGSRSKIASRP
jgi:AcrR family transcriptional regulator